MPLVALRISKQEHIPPYNHHRCPTWAKACHLGGDMTSVHTTCDAFKEGMPLPCQVKVHYETTPPRCDQEKKNVTVINIYFVTKNK